MCEVDIGKAPSPPPSLDAGRVGSEEQTNLSHQLAAAYPVIDGQRWEALPILFGWAFKGYRKADSWAQRLHRK